MTTKITDQILQSIKSITIEKFVRDGIMTRAESEKFMEDIYTTDDLVVVGRVIGTLRDKGYNVQNMSMPDIRLAIEENDMKMYMYDKCNVTIDVSRGRHAIDEDAIDCISVHVPIMYIQKRMNGIDSEYRDFLGEPPRVTDGGLAMIEYVRKYLILANMGKLQ